MEQNLDLIVGDGIRFLESLANYYGTDRAMEVWESMGTAMGQDVKGAVFFAMLTGQSSTRVRIYKGDSTRANMIPAIKAIRTATGYGLKEAKDVVDQVDSGQEIQIECQRHQDKSNLVRELHNFGYLTR